MDKSRFRLILKETAETENFCEDKAAYQTVYAGPRGAIAAPTAGLHFTTELLDFLQVEGTTVVKLTLHVGYGTFVPVRVADIRHHKMHAEQFAISEKSAAIINRARDEGKRVIAVGTTCVRTLEYSADSRGYVKAGNGQVRSVYLSGLSL